MLSLCTIDVNQSQIGNEVTVIWGNPGGPQKEIRAKVAPAPYKQDNRRLDVTKM
jgi:vanillate/3-O-methylgallate O-demethylase